jgi:hypothetical protein
MLYRAKSGNPGPKKQKECSRNQPVQHDLKTFRETWPLMSYLSSGHLKKEAHDFDKKVTPYSAYLSGIWSLKAY